MAQPLFGMAQVWRTTSFQLTSFFVENCLPFLSYIWKLFSCCILLGGQRNPPESMQRRFEELNSIPRTFGEGMAHERLL